jgi:polyketide synthase PksN
MFQAPGTLLSRRLLQEFYEQTNSNGTEIAHHHQERWVRKIKPLQGMPDKDLSSFKDKGVYLISGGIGKLGLLFAKYLAEQFQARLVLIGRSPLNRKNQVVLDDIQALGGEAIYLQTDVTSLQSVQEMINAAKKSFKAIDGVIHSAGVSSADPVTDITKDRFEQILEAKVQGTINLDRATQKESLDFFVMFSSISALIGDFGSCSYAVGNRFMGRYAALRERWKNRGERSGLSISINWPLWDEGGMEMPAEEEAVYFNYSGMNALSAKEGIDAFLQILHAGMHHIVPVSGDFQKIHRIFQLQEDSAKPRASAGETQLPITVAEKQPEQMRVPTMKNCRQLPRIRN